MNLVFDLDGTLIDARPRMYHLFCQLVPQAQLSFDAYWDFKRAKVSHEQLLQREFGYTAAQLDRFNVAWMDAIESPAMLALDTCLPGVAAALQRLQQQARLHVCTARQLRQPVLDQLERLQLASYFDSVMVTEQRSSKQALIAALPDLSHADWLLGDTGHDINVGKALGLHTCAVLSGFLSHASLLPYGAECILASVADFKLPA
ncbi:HAD family hydrolase [Pseudoduganella danionis]|uniref:HAD family hydrolase n=1 Tax=Pseudoduganella danionis TaxID=1890295 RepID=UPI0035AFD2C4